MTLMVSHTNVNGCLKAVKFLVFVCINLFHWQFVCIFWGRLRGYGTTMTRTTAEYWEFRTHVHVHLFSLTTTSCVLLSPLSCQKISSPVWLPTLRIAAMWVSSLGPYGSSTELKENIWGESLEFLPVRRGKGFYWWKSVWSNYEKMGILDTKLFWKNLWRMAHYLHTFNFTNVNIRWT